MKCVTNVVTGEIARVSNERAEELCGGIVPAPNSSRWIFCTKKEWKATTRQLNERDNANAPKPQDTMSNLEKRKQRLYVKR